MGNRVGNVRHFEHLEDRCLLAADPIISEFLAKNSATLLDGDGNSADWVEIWNRGDQSIDLEGSHLTDDAGNPTRWQFPTTPLESNQRLLVFATGQDQDDYVDPGGNLHTNFKLDGDSEYLALVHPDGQTIASQFAPAFPEQRSDISYGIETHLVETPLIDDSSLAHVLVPAEPVVDWQQPGFDDTQWLGGQMPVRASIGFERLGDVELPEGLVTHFAFDGEPGDSIARESVSEVVPAIQGTMTATAGKFSDAAVFDGSTSIAMESAPVGLTDGFSILAWIKPAARNRTILSALSDDLQSGFWFGYNSDGPWLGIAAGADQSTGGSGAWTNARAPDTAVELDQWYHLAATFDPSDSQQEVKLYLNGQQLSDGVEGVDLPDGFMGDPESVEMLVGLHNAGNFPFEGSLDDLAVFNRPLPAAEIQAFSRFGVAGGGPLLAPLLQADIGDLMIGRNSSAYIRIPFDAPTPNQYSRLDLSIQSNDGFVAYLNGVEVARHNAPETVDWQSAAVDSVRPFDSLTELHFDLRSHLSRLKESDNILALQALNSSADDSTLLIRPVLTAAVVEERMAYFVEPTPGRANSVGIAGFVDDTTTSISRGFFSQPFQVEMQTATENATIRYTLDGSRPTENHGEIYETSVAIAATTTLRAAAFLPDHMPSAIETQTYLFLQDVIDQPTDPEGFPNTWGRYRIGPVGRPVPADYEMEPEKTERHADTIEDDLKSIPTLSIVMDQDDLFNGDDGIYTNPFIDREIRERATSVEWFEAAGNRELQVDAGIRVFGGWSRHFWATPKKSFALKFKRPFGPTKLEFPLFAENQVDSKIPGTEVFDTVLLRAVFSDAWPDAASPPQYLRDLNSRYMQLAMGHLSSHGTWVHLYLNGLYWGIYNVSERPDASFLAAYLGGDKSEYDAVKHTGLCGPGCATINSFEVIDGGEEAREGFQAALDAAREDLSDPEKYAALAELVDMENLADYILLQHYTGNVDWPQKNWYANRKREGGEGWKFYVWDSEYTLRDVNDTRLNTANENTPAFLFSRARRSPEFRLLFADRVQKHLFNDGVLQPDRNIARYEALATQIEQAIKGEVARWADNDDTRRGRTFYSFEFWENRRDAVLQQFFPDRHAIAIEQLQRANLFPEFDAPTFSQFGGTLERDQAISITAPQGEIFYTLDGQDPMDAGIAYEAPISLSTAATLKARVRFEDEWSALTEAAFVTAHVAGDWNNDNQIDAQDIALFCLALRQDTQELQFDLNQNGSVDSQDRDMLVQDLLDTTYGDANLDGLFDSADLIAVFQAGQFQDEVEGNSLWIQGDWDCDGEFTSSDLILAFQSGSYAAMVRTGRGLDSAEQ